MWGWVIPPPPAIFRFCCKASIYQKVNWLKEGINQLQIPEFVANLPVIVKDKLKELFSRQAYLPYVGPTSVWIVLFVIAPLGFIFYFSFLSVGPSGQITYAFTLKNYLALFRGLYGMIFLRTLLFASVTNMICLLIGYPLAYLIVQHRGKSKILLLFLVIMPSWTLYLIRLYALKTLVGSTGLINSALLNLGLISSPLEILYTPSAVVIGLIYTWLPFMVLPIYASLEGLDPSLLEAAEDLGATPLRRFFTVTLPLTKGGIFAGTILTFIPALGDWLSPLLLGGAKVMMAGSLVEHYFIKVGNIPAGSSIASALAAVVLLIIYLSMKLGGEEALERII